MAIAIRICKHCKKSYDAVVGVNKSIYCSDCKDTIDYYDKEADVNIPEEHIQLPAECNESEGLTEINIPDDLLQFVNSIDVDKIKPNPKKTRIIDDMARSKR